MCNPASEQEQRHASASHSRSMSNPFTPRANTAPSAEEIEAERKACKAFDDHSSIDYLGGSFDAVKSQYPEDICRGFIAPPRSAAVNASGWQFCVKLQPKPGADPKQQVRCTVVVNQTTGAICNHASSLVTCSSGIDTFENGHMKKWHKAEYTAMQACAGTLRSWRTTILPPPLLQVAGMATLWPRTCSRCKSAPT